MEKIALCLPEKLYCCVGREISIYYYNILRCTNVHNYRFRVSGVGGAVRNFGDRLSIIPTEPGERGIKLDVMYNDEVVLSHQMKLIFLADEAPAMKAMFIGDSLIEGSYAQAELENMTKGAIQFCGTRTTTRPDADGNTHTMHHEGRSSWRTVHYMDEKKGETVNEFYNPETKTFDVPYYMGKHPEFADVTDLFIQLGTNDAGAVTTEDFVKNLRFMFDSVKAFNPDIRLYLLIVPPNTSCGYGWGNINCSDTLSLKNILFDYAVALYEAAWEDVTLIPLFLNLDCFYDFPHKEIPRSVRNPELMTVCCDNVHPAPCGFYKMADTTYGAILGRFSDK